MTTKHTKGPWFFHDGNIYAKKPALLPKLADRSVKIVGYDHKTVFTDKDMSIEEMHANARLIAAAPELLECLEKALNQIDTLSAGCEYLKLPDTKTTTAYQQARTAIAKAKGGAV